MSGGESKASIEGSKGTGLGGEKRERTVASILNNIHRKLINSPARAVTSNLLHVPPYKRKATESKAQVNEQAVGQYLAKSLESLFINLAYRGMHNVQRNTEAKNSGEDGGANTPLASHLATQLQSSELDFKQEVAYCLGSIWKNIKYYDLPDAELRHFKKICNRIAQATDAPFKLLNVKPNTRPAEAGHKYCLKQESINTDALNTKTKTRQKKNWLWWSAVFVAFFYCIGEGSSAWVMAGMVPWMVVPVFIGGMLVNYFLVQDDAYSLLKKLFIRRNTESIGLAYQILYGTLSFAAAAMGGALSFNSTMAAFSTLFGALAAYTGLAWLTVLANIFVIVPIVTVIALTAFFNACMCEYHATGFARITKFFDDKFNPKHFRDDQGHLRVAKYLCSMALATLQVALTIGIGILVNVVTSGNFQTSFASFTQKVFHLFHYNLSQGIANTVGLVGMLIGFLPNALTYMRSVSSAVNTFISAPYNMALYTYTLCSEYANPLKLFGLLCQGVMTVIISAFALGNAYGQGGSANNPASMRYISEVFTLIGAKASAVFIHLTGFISAASASFGANSRAAAEAINNQVRVKTRDASLVVKGTAKPLLYILKRDSSNSGDEKEDLEAAATYDEITHASYFPQLKPG